MPDHFLHRPTAEPGDVRSGVLASLLREHPIAITGMGVFSAAGTTVADFGKRVMAGSCPAVWTPPEGGVRFALCPAPAMDLESPEFRQVRRMDRAAQMALAAARQAWSDAALGETASFPGERGGVIVGSSRGPAGKWTEWLAHELAGGCKPSYASNSTTACLSGILSMTFRTLGSASTVAAACASSAHAIALGAEQILLGKTDVMLAGGTEATLHPSLVRQLAAAGVLGSHANAGQVCRPFALDRDGTVLGEGAAFLLLESAACARRRGARIHAWLAGWAMGSEAYRRSGISEEAEGLRRVMVRALEVAGLAPEDLGYLNAHGTGTMLNDRTESRAIRRIFPAGIPCSSTKPVTGHCMGASSAMEAIISVLALQQQRLPPSPCALPRDPEGPADLIVGGSREARIRAAMSNSSGFWGNNASLVFTRADDAPDQPGR